MAAIQWRDSYNIGVEQFDQEHHKIVELIEILYTTMRTKEYGDQVKKAINELVEYTGYHFSNEEKVMMKNDYPGLEEHYQEHVKLKAQVEEFLEDEENMTGEKVSEFYRFMREWLLEHILGADKKLGEFMQELQGTQ